jgi:DNA-binding protein YbaB
MNLIEQAAQLSADAEHLYSVTKRRKETLRTAETQALKATGDAASPDGAVRVTVDAGGMVTSLALTPAALRKDPDDLARVLTSVIQEAAGRVRAAVRGVYEPLRGEGIVRGMPVLLPEPEAPSPAPPRPVDESSYEERTITRRRR